MANMSINPIEKISNMRSLIDGIKEESEKHYSLAVALRGRLKEDEDSVIEYNLATILEDELSSNAMFVRMEDLIDELEKSLIAQAA